MSAGKPQRCLVHWGGWPGHAPERWKDVLSGWMTSWGFDVDTEADLDVFRDVERLSQYDLIVPLWTLGELGVEQERGLTASVAGGVGLAGFHGMCGAFCASAQYKWMTGGQLVVHPGDASVTYDVRIVDQDHAITAGLGDFTMVRTEQYYMHVDPSIHVLATTTFGNGCVNPVAWTHRWGKGRVFYVSVGHSPEDFQPPEATALLRRGLAWASRSGGAA